MHDMYNKILCYAYMVATKCAHYKGRYKYNLDMLSILVVT